MTMRRAIGSYAIDASDEDKRYALRLAVEDALFELVELGGDPDDLEDLCIDAIANAADEKRTRAEDA